MRPATVLLLRAEPDKLYESLYSLPGTRVAHFNDLLRQQSENAYLKSKNRWILRFWRVFLGFLIFSIFDDFPMVSLSISISWLDFLPGGGLRSPGHWIFTQNGNFVKDVTGRNKKYQKYQLWAYNEFIIPPLPRALALHALIISHLPGKLSKCKTTVQNLHTMQKLCPKYPTCLLILILRLAAPCHRITL